MLNATFMGGRVNLNLLQNFLICKGMGREFSNFNHRLQISYHVFPDMTALITSELLF